jgi:hypothetical protein
MAGIDRLSERIAWIDLSFVERDRTPRWAIEVGIRCHLAGMSLREVSKFLEGFGINRSHVAIHNWIVLAVGIRFARVVGGFPVTADVLTDFRISEHVISLQENPCSVDILGFAFTGFDESVKRPMVFVREIDDIFLRSHS